MSRITQTFTTARAEHRAAMIYYVTAGFPDTAATDAAVDALVAGGCDLLELGIPFSDPLADGPTIQHASFEALKAGMTIDKVLKLCAGIRARHPQLAIVLFTAYNPIFHFGDAAFANAAASAGADALLVPDVPPEEAEPLLSATRAAGLQLIFLAAPTTTPERAKKIADATSGFLYYISLKGVTGARAALPPELREKVTALKALTPTPVAVGFGVSEPAQAAEIATFADGVIIGSALIKLIAETPRAQLAEAVQNYAAAMRAATVLAPK